MGSALAREAALQYEVKELNEKVEESEGNLHIEYAKLAHIRNDEVLEVPYAAKFKKGWKSSSNIRKQQKIARKPFNDNEFLSQVDDEDTASANDTDSDCNSDCDSYCDTGCGSCELRIWLASELGGDDPARYCADLDEYLMDDEAREESYVESRPFMTPCGPLKDYFMSKKGRAYELGDFDLWRLGKLLIANGVFQVRHRTTCVPSRMTTSGMEL